MNLLSQDSSPGADFSPLGVRVCSKCNETKRKTEFPRAPLSNRGGGYSYRCKECERARCKARYQANRDEVLERFKARHTEVLHFGIDEKYGDTWEWLHVAMVTIGFIASGYRRTIQ
jgi:hypothetical protein